MFSTPGLQIPGLSDLLPGLAGLQIPTVGEASQLDRAACGPQLSGTTLGPYAIGSDSPPRMALGNFGELSPPPRNAPASQSVAMMSSQIVESMLESNDHHQSLIRDTSVYLAPNEYSSLGTTKIEFPAPYGQSLPPLAGEGSDRHMLSIMTSDNNWDSLAFFTGDNIEQLASQWIQKRGLNPAFQQGLVSQMRQMVDMKLITASVDIVDLL